MIPYEKTQGDGGKVKLPFNRKNKENLWQNKTPIDCIYAYSDLNRSIQRYVMAAIGNIPLVIQCKHPRSHNCNTILKLDVMSKG